MDTQALETTNRSYILPSTRTTAQSALHFHQGGKKNGNKLCKLQTDGAENPFFFILLLVFYYPSIGPLASLKSRISRLLHN